MTITRLEAEAGRNVELMWLTNRLCPDFKTISEFRRSNGEALRLVCAELVFSFRSLNLLSNTVAIDGSKFKAVNNRDKNFTKAKMKRRKAEIAASIDYYFDKIEEADLAEPPQDTRTMEEKIAALKEEMKRLKKVDARMRKAPGEQISLTDPDARSMKTRGQGIVGYNTQIAVEAKNHFIVTHEVTNVGTDRRQLTNMAIKARAAVAPKGNRKLKVVANQGYCRAEELLACKEAAIPVYVAKPDTSGKKKGEFSRRMFRYFVS